MTSLAIANVAPSKKILRAAAWTLGAALAFTAVAGFLHTPAGRPLLAKLGIACPIRPGTAEQVDRARAFGTARLRGKPDAPARPALGFFLEKTTLADFETWAATHRLSCEKIAKTDTLRACVNVPANVIGQPEWFGPAEEVSFEFRKDRTLASVATMRRRLPVEKANAITTELGKRLGAELSTPHVSGGVNAPAHFAKSPLQAYKEEWLFGDYNATLSEVRLADTGLMVREQYLSGR